MLFNDLLGIDYIVSAITICCNNQSLVRKGDAGKVISFCCEIGHSVKGKKTTVLGKSVYTFPPLISSFWE